MEEALKKRYIRLIYAGAFRYLGIVLVLCAIISALYRSRMYFVFALCAGGGFFISWGWFTYLALTGMKVYGFGKLPKQKKKVPYMYRKDKGTHILMRFCCTSVKSSWESDTPSFRSSSKSSEDMANAGFL